MYQPEEEKPCNNEDIIAYLDALIKYENSWIKGLSKQPDLKCKINVEEMNGILGITSSAVTPINKLSKKDLTTLLNHFKNLQDDSSTIMGPNITEKDNNDIVTLKKKLKEKEKEQKELSDLKQYYIDKIIDVPRELSTSLDNVSIAVYDLREELEKANTYKHYNGGKRKSKRRKSKNSTKKGKKGRKSNKKSMKKSMKK